MILCSLGCLEIFIMKGLKKINKENERKGKHLSLVFPSRALIGSGAGRVNPVSSRNHVSFI